MRMNVYPYMSEVHFLHKHVSTAKSDTFNRVKPKSFDKKR